MHYRTFARLIAFAILIPHSGTPTRAQQKLPQRQAPPSLAQEIHDFWTTDNGLPQNAVNEIIQTHDGYVWLATQEGLARFDGIQFTIFDKRTTAEFQNNDVWTILEARDRTLWAGTTGGLLRLKDGRFTRFTSADGLSNDIIRSLYEDSSGTLWVGTNKGLNQIRDGAVSTFPHREDFSNDIVRTICRDAKNDVWVGTDGNGLRRLNEESLRTFTTTDGLSSNFVLSLAPDDYGGIWVGTNGGGLNNYSHDKFSKVAPTTRNLGPIIFRIYHDSRGSTWFATSDGLSLLMNPSPPFSFATYTTKDGLSRNTIYSVLLDREGSLWVGTFGGGLDRFVAGTFTSVSRDEGLTDDFIYTVYQDRSGKMLIGTENGGLDILTGGAVSSYTTANGLSNNGVPALREDRAGNLWVGTFGGGLNRIRNREVIVFTTAEGLANDFVRAIVEDATGNLWVGTRNGLSRYSHGRFTTFTTKDGLANDFIRTLFVDSNGDLWIGTFGGGLSRYSHGSFTTFNTNDGLSSNDVRCVVEDPDGTMWIGTDGGGLSRWKDRTFKAITVKNGLFDDVVLCILEDDYGNFWMSCNKGIFQAQKKDLNDFADGKINSVTCLAHGKDDGMRSIECNAGQPAGWKSKDGRLWFPTIKGVVIVDPAHIAKNSQAPPVVIEQAIGNGETSNEASRPVFSAGTDRVEFHYTALSFIAPKKIQFKYMIVGLDRRWVDAGPRRIAYYTNIPPGTYTFRVIAANSDGVWNDTGASLKFTMVSFFYETRIFVVLCAAIVGMGGVGVYELRVRQLKRREVQLKTMIEERTHDLQKQTAIARQANSFKSKLLGVVAHDLKSPLISIRGFVQLLKEDLALIPEAFQKAELVNRLSQNLLDLINELLESTSIESGIIQLVKRSVDVCLLASSVVDFNEIHAERKQQHIETSFEQPGTCIVEADSGRLSEVMDNLVSNAIKYSPPGKTIWVAVSRTPSTVRFSVKDEGPGLSEEDKMFLFERFGRLSARPTAGEPSSGFGLAIVKQLVELHNGSVWAESEGRRGSTFLIELPVLSDITTRVASRPQA